MRPYAPLRPEKVNEIQQVLQDTEGLTLTQKIFFVFLRVKEASITELTKAFFPFQGPPKFRRKGVDYEINTLMDSMYVAVEKLHYYKSKRHMKVGIRDFRKSVFAKAFVIRMLKNKNNEWVHLDIQTKEEYEKHKLDDKLDAVVSGIEALREADHETLKLTPEQRRAIKKEQLKALQAKIRGS